MSNRYVRDGSPISSKVPLSERRPNDHSNMYGVYRGLIMQVIYPDNPKNLTKERVEYAVKVRGQVYPNATSMRESGGVYNYQERVRKGVEDSTSNKISKGTYDELLDGEHVWVLFIEGNGNAPLIIGGADHPRHGSYKKLKKADGLMDIYEFNGVEFLKDKDSNYTITQVGRKDPKGKILNQAAVNAFLKFYGNGDYEINTHGTQGTADLRMKFNKEAKRFELYAQNNKLEMDSVGITVTDKNGNKIEMKNGEIKITAAGKCIVNSSGATEVTAGADVKVTASGKAQVTAATIELNGQAGQILTTVTDPVIDLIYGVPTTGVPTVKSG